MTAPAWSSLPERPTTTPGVARRVAAAVWIAAAGPSGWALGAGDENWWALAVWLAGGALTAWWIVRQRPGPVPPRGGLTPAVASVAVGSLLGLLHTSSAMAVPAMVLTLVVPLISRSRVSHRVGESVGGAVARVITWVLFTALWVPAVLVPHLYSRVSSADPFAGSGRWAVPPVRKSDPSATWENDRQPAVGTLRRHLAATTSLLVAGMVAWLIVDAVRAPDPPTGFNLADIVESDAAESNRPVEFPAPDGLSESRGEDDGLAALGNDPWLPELLSDEGLLNDDGKAMRRESLVPLQDVRTTWVNISGGVRRSWTPPPCTCRRLTVWMYGGSTTIGIFQRDEYTIASQLARVAYEHGVALDMQNRGVPGWRHADESARFAWDLSSGERPDLVIFYDGVNNMGNDSPEPINASLDHLWENSPRASGDPPPAPPGGSVTTTDDRERLAESIGERYGLETRVSQLLAADAGVPVHFVWQPSRLTKPFDPAEPHHDSRGENALRRIAQSVPEQLPDYVIDLTRSLADVDRPVFGDDAHHNEYAARIIAEKLFDALAGDLARISNS